MATPGAPTDTDAAGRAASAFALVEGWLLSDPMAALLAAFGRQLPAAGTSRVGGGQDMTGWLHLSEELPSWLGPVVADAADVAGLSPTQSDILRRTLVVERMAAADFNFRTRDGEHYRERSQAVAANFDTGLRDRVLDLADQLGLVSPRATRHGRYDGMLVMGGGYRSPLLRARYAAQLRAGGVELGGRSFLGSPRFLIEEPPELPAVEDYAPGATDEFDLMAGAARTGFGLRPAAVTFLCGCTSSDVRCPNWRCRGADGADRTPPAYTHERRLDLLDGDDRRGGAVLSASTGRPPYRPDTSDTFALWARHADPRPGQRVLVVTTQVFVPFQTFDGIRRLYLRHGVDVDTVGFGAEWGDRPQTAEYLLQETLSAIRSGRRLLVDAAETLITHATPG